MKEKLYTARQIGLIKNCHKDLVNRRAKCRGIKPTMIKNACAYNENQIKAMFSKFSIHDRVNAAEEVIYVNRETHFFESKMNYMEVEDLPEWDNKLNNNHK